MSRKNITPVKNPNDASIYELSRKIDSLCSVVADLSAKMNIIEMSLQPTAPIKNQTIVSVHELSQKIDSLCNIVADLSSKINNTEINENKSFEDESFEDEYKRYIHARMHKNINVQKNNV